ncbi:MAG: dihydrofolate reductase family protein [Acidobacteriaceae bacterium]|nr:dihydrofolate reductase family protein [Acidobacteriaceae bacterium]
MRKLRIGVHISLDGIIETNDGYLYGDWTAPFRSPAGLARITAIHSQPFDLILGRHTYDLWSQHWPKISGTPIADGINNATKYIATHHPESLAWGPHEALGTDLIADIQRLKSTEGPDLMLWGSSTLTTPVLEHKLADELMLVVYPVLLGTGKRLFAEGSAPMSTFKLADTQTTPTGVLLNTYTLAD